LGFHISIGSLAEASIFAVHVEDSGARTPRPDIDAYDILFAAHRKFLPLLVV
jgi:hypothetical protein